MIVKDAVGRELAVGDKVAYVRPYYHDLGISKVKYLTRCGATLESGSNRNSRQMIRLESVESTE